MRSRKFLGRNININFPDGSVVPDESAVTSDAISRTKHAYTVWDEQSGLGHHWFVVDLDPPTGRQTLYVESDTQDSLEPKAFWSAMEDALRQGQFSIHIFKDSWKPCEVVNRFQGPNLIISKPVVDESVLHFVHQILDGHGLELVEMDGERYVHKFAVVPDLLMVLQCEIESYQRLEQSPYVLNISHAVRSTNADFDGCVRGFLLPFTGEALASDVWDWSIEDKESLMLDLLDAVHDFEMRGAVHTDLKGANILLTPDGMKLIDLDFLGSTAPWRSPFEDSSRQAAVHTFGKTVWELFTEQVPHGMMMSEVEVEGSLPPYLMDLVRDCCVEHKYQCIKQLFDATEQVLTPVRARRIPTSKLVASHQKGGNARGKG